MEETKASDWSHLFIDKEVVRRLVAEQNEKIGFVPAPTVPPRRIREMMRAEGIRAEDNIFSCGIIAARDEE
jgi:hypothetical protein